MKYWNQEFPLKCEEMEQNQDMCTFSNLKWLSCDFFFFFEGYSATGFPILEAYVKISENV